MFYLTEYDCFILVGEDFAVDVFADGSRKDNLFEVFAFVDEVGWCVLVGDAHDILLDDGTCVELGGHIVAGGSDNLHAALPCLMVGLGADEGGEEGVVDVDDVVGVGLNHLLGNHLHLASQHDEGNAVVAQQLHLFLFLLGFVLLCDWEDVVGDAELLGHVLQVGVVGDDEGYLAIPFAGCVACQHVIEAVAHLRNKDGHARLDVGEVEAQLHVVLLGVKCGEVVLYLVAGNGKVLKFPLDTGEEHMLDVVDILVEIDDITTIDGDEIRYLGKDAGTVGAVE